MTINNEQMSMFDENGNPIVQVMQQPQLPNNEEEKLPKYRQNNLGTTLAKIFGDLPLGLLGYDLSGNINDRRERNFKEENDIDEKTQRAIDSSNTDEMRRLQDKINNSGFGASRTGTGFDVKLGDAISAQKKVEGENIADSIIRGTKKEYGSVSLADALSYANDNNITLTPEKRAILKEFIGTQNETSGAEHTRGIETQNAESQRTNSLAAMNKSIEGVSVPGTMGVNQETGLIEGTEYRYNPSGEREEFIGTQNNKQEEIRLRQKELDNAVSTRRADDFKNLMATTNDQIRNMTTRIAALVGMSSPDLEKTIASNIDGVSPETRMQLMGKYGDEVDKLLSDIAIEEAFLNSTKVAEAARVFGFNNIQQLRVFSHQSGNTTNKNRTDALNELGVPNAPPPQQESNRQTSVSNIESE